MIKKFTSGNPIDTQAVVEKFNALPIAEFPLGGKFENGNFVFEFDMAGATALQIGTVLFTDPYAPIKIADGMNEWLDKNGIKSVSEITGTVKPW